jgi:glycosyltransferase involved in cell wall biosynthesis
VALKANLKILLVTEASSAGVGRHVIDLAKGLREAGHTVHLIYSPVRIDARFRNGLDQLGKLRVPVTPLAMKRSPHPHDAVCCVRIRRYVQQHGPFDVIHGQSSKGGALARLAGFSLPGVRVYTPHAMYTMNPELKPLPRLVLGRIEQFLSWLGHGVILVSEDEHRHALETGMTREKLFVVPNGIALDLRADVSAARAALGLSASELCVGFVGRFAPQKAPEDLLKSFARVAGRVPNVRLAMVGEGPMAPALHAEAERLGIQQRVLWPGARDGQSAMAAFDIFALPSRYEGFPYVLLEAMVAGLPVVSTRVGGTQTLIEDGQNGWLVPAGCPDVMAEALQRLLVNEPLRRQMGAVTRRRVQDYSLEHMVNRTLAVYETLLSRRRN